MAAITYALIVLCYSFGCFAAFRLGKNQGLEEGVERLVTYVAEKRGWTIKKTVQELMGRKV